MSFKRRASSIAKSPASERPPLPNGVRLSLSNATPITSWGLASIDTAIGGGLPLGTLTIVTEDFPSAYYQPITSYLIAQGVHDEHAVAIASFHSSSHNLLAQLPAPAERRSTDPDSVRTAQRDVQHMEIAWRYQKHADPSTHIVTGDSTRSLAHSFDLSHNYPVPGNAPISCLDRKTFAMSLSSLLQQLKMHVEKSSSEGRLARLVVQGLSSAFIKSENDVSLTEFLCRLRALCRSYGCVAVVTCARDIPIRLQSVSGDALLQLDSFEGRGAGVAGLGKEWLGVLVIKKSYREGRGPCARGKGDAWVFKRGRRKYTMERATAAPDEDDENDNDKSRPSSTTQSEQAIKRISSGICSSKPQSAFDF